MPSAPLQPLSLVATGIYGTNFQSSSTLLDPKWATNAINMVFDASGRLAVRSGWVPQNTTPMSGSPVIRSIFEYTPITGANQVVSAGGNKIYSGTSTLTNITGALTPSADNWKFVNFNGLVYGLQASHPLIQWNGTGNFAATTAATGSVPSGNELLSAFGRLWGTDSTGQVLQYSQLLDATNWNVTGAGSFNLTSVWGTGNDAIVALAAFNNFLVVFGSRNIILWQDGSGSALGMDPTHMYVSDQISGVGCIARDSVQNIAGTDLAFLSAAGVQSLQRLLIERSSPLRNVSVNVRDVLNNYVASETAANIKSTYNAYNGFYLLILPNSGNIFAFDTRIALPDGSWRVTTWNNFIPTAIVTLHDQRTTYSGQTGYIYQYNDYQDNSGSYTCTYESGWLSLGEEVQTRVKMLKRLSTIFSMSGSGTLTFKWAYDFSSTWNYAPLTINGAGSPGEWGLAQWGVDTWGGGPTLYDMETPTNGSGQFIKIGLDFTTSGNSFAVQQMQLYAKVGRVI